MARRPLIRIGTRGSLLALAQAGQVRRTLAGKFPSFRFELVVIRTRGDQYQSVEWFRENNVGVFTREIERRLLDRRIDLAVHSLKDLPTDLPDELALGAFPKRQDARDAIVTRTGLSLSRLRPGAKVGTGSPRRKRQLAALRPDLELIDIRGNLDTRVGRVLVRKDLDAVVLAMAGLSRIGRFLRHAKPISPRLVLPAVGQAALGIELRRSDWLARGLVAALNHAPTERRVLAERAFLKALHGGCRVPVGVRSVLRDGQLKLEGCVCSVRSDRQIRAAVSGRADKPEETGRRLAKLLLRRGAGRILAEARAGGAA